MRSGFWVCMCLAISFTHGELGWSGRSIILCAEICCLVNIQSYLSVNAYGKHYTVQVCWEVTIVELLLDTDQEFEPKIK